MSKFIAFAILPFNLLILAQDYNSELTRVSESLVEELNGTNTHTIAVVDFTDLQGNITELGRFLSEEFSVSLANAKSNLQIMDRIHLNSILRELKLNASGLFDPKSAKKVGEIGGVDAIVTGAITPLGDNVRITVKVIDTKTARILTAKRGNLANTQAIKDLLNAGIQNYSKSTPKSTPKRTPNSKQQKSRESNGYVITLLACNKSSDMVTVEFLIENQMEDRKLGFYYSNNNTEKKTRFFGNDGTVYEPDQISIGNLVYDKSSWMEYPMVKGIPTKAFAKFKISNGLDSASLIELGFYDYPSKTVFKVKFRDIAILSN